MSSYAEKTSAANAATAAVDVRGLNAQVIAELARAAVPKHHDLNLPGCAPRILWVDKTITNLEGALPAPLRKRGHADLVDPESFASYVNQHKTAGTVLVGDADEKGGDFRALLDFHVPNAGEDAKTASATTAADVNPARWTEHTARMELEPTPEWARWLGISGRELDQKTFAEFLEDNAVDLVVPEGDAGRGFPTQQELMSVASTLQIKTDVKFASSVKLQNGQVQLGYVESIEGGHGAEGKLTIPERFGLALAPFRGTDKYLVTARLRYRGTGGRAVFRVEIERPHKIVESAFNDVRKKIHALTGLQPLVGSITPQARPQI